MKKAVEITMVTIENGTATVTYATGTTRKYAEADMPKTVKAWLGKKQVKSTDDERFWGVSCENGQYGGDDSFLCFGSYTQTRQYVIENYPDCIWYEIVPEGQAMVENYKKYAPGQIKYLTRPAENMVLENTDFVLVDTSATGFVLVDTPEEPMVTALVPVATSTALVTMVPVTVGTDDTVEAEAEAAETILVAGEALRAQALQEAAETAAKAVKVITKAAEVTAKVAKAVAQTAPEVARKAASGTVWTMDKLVDLYYWVTTYLPIAARWLAVHLIWTIQGAIPVVTGATRKATAAAKVAGLGVARAASAVAGWGLVGALAGISISIKVGRMAADGWRLREEIIKEQAA